MLGFKRGGVGHVLIKTDSIHETRLKARGENGAVLISDVTYLPQQRTRVYGTVIQLPIHLGMGIIGMVSPGVPGYGAIRVYKDHDMEQPSHAFYKIGGTTKYKFMSDIRPDVEMNDKIYFKWRALAQKNNLVAKSKGENPEFIFKIPYDQIICVVRDGKIIPIGANVLIDPMIETFDDILEPTYYSNPGPNGERVERPKSEWIQKKAFPENIVRHGIVKHFGKPLRGDLCYLEPEMKVLMKLNLKNMFHIEGKEYIVIRQDKLIAKLK